MPWVISSLSGALNVLEVTKLSFAFSYQEHSRFFSRTGNSEAVDIARIAADQHTHTVTLTVHVWNELPL